jgi:hypothetical protein
MTNAHIDRLTRHIVTTGRATTFVIGRSGKGETATGSG